MGSGFTDLLAVLEADVEKPFTSLLFISDIWYGPKTILTYSSVVFTLGALLIALHMSAVYSLLLFLALIAFILQLVQYYIGFSTIPSEFYKTTISFKNVLSCSRNCMVNGNSLFSLHLFCRDCQYNCGKAFDSVRKCTVRL